MSVIRIVFFAIIAVYLCLFLVFAALTGKPFKAILINSVSGCFALIVLSLIKNLLSINIAVNIYSLLVSLIWGIPGVIMQLTLNSIF